MRRSRLAAIAVCLACILSPEAGSAQDSAAAEALFQKGLSEMDQGHFGVACPAIAESYRLDSRPGTLFTLAECESQAGGVASASTHYNDYLQLFARMPDEQKSRQAGRERVAREQITVLAPQIPHLILFLPSSAPLGTQVYRNDIPLSAPSLGIPLPVDPGPHRIVVQAPNRPASTVVLNISAGETRKYALAVAPAPAPAASATAPRPVVAAVALAPGLPDRTPTYILGALGLEGLAVGTVTGLLAWQKKSTINRECQDHYCSAEGKSAADSAHTLGLISTSSFAIGAASLIGAALLWERGKEQPKSLRPVVVSDGRSTAVLSVGGVF